MANRSRYWLTENTKVPLPAQKFNSLSTSLSTEDHSAQTPWSQQLSTTSDSEIPNIAPSTIQNNNKVHGSVQQWLKSASPISSNFTRQSDDSIQVNGNEFSNPAQRLTSPLTSYDTTDQTFYTEDSFLVLHPPKDNSRSEFRAGILRNKTQTPSAVSSSARRSVPRTPQSVGSSRSNLSRLNQTETNSGCYVAVMEGRGNARGEIGLASISLANPTLVLCQFSDTSTYVRTLTKLAIFNPSDILIPQAGIFNSGDRSKLYQDIEEKFCFATTSQLHRKYFNESRGLETVKHLCAPDYCSVELQLGHKYYALAAAYALLKYVEFIQNVVFAPKSIKVEFQASANSMMIDLETAINVELVFSNYHSKSTHSLFGFLNHCSTSGGVKFLRSSLFQPSTQPEVIQSRLDTIEELIAKPEIQSGLMSTLSRFCDIDQLLSLCVVIPKQETLSTMDKKINQVIGLKHALELVNPLHTILSGEIQSKLLLDIRKSLEDPAYQIVLAKVQRIIHDEARVLKGTAAMRHQRCFAIRNGINGLLDLTRRTYCEMIEDIEKHIRLLSEKHGVPIKMGYSGQRGFHAQLSTSSKNLRLKLSDLPSNFVRPQKLRSMIVFTTSEIIRLDKRSQDILRNISLMSSSLISALVAKIRESIGCLYKLSEIVSTLDLVVSLTEVSSMEGFIRPTFGDSLQVTNGSHPILVHLSTGRYKMGGKQKCVPLEATLDIVANDVKATSESSFHILTGANMSGKSTYLKQIVLLQVLAQVGCFVPAESAQFRMADAIYTRLGTSDNLECNSSTFTLEMKEMSYILSNMTSHSLVIIDELGRGTSIEEGGAICWAISEAIIEVGAFTFFATHMELLTKLVNLHSKAKNSFFLSDGDCENDADSSIKPHKLVSGSVTRKHYGIDFARTTSFPPEIIERALEISASMGDSDQFIWRESESESQWVNCQTLVHRLQTLSRQPIETVVDKLKELQLVFSGQNSQSDEGDTTEENNSNNF